MNLRITAKIIVRKWLDYNHETRDYETVLSEEVDGEVQTLYLTKNKVRVGYIDPWRGTKESKDYPIGDECKLTYYIDDKEI